MKISRKVEIKEDIYNALWANFIEGSVLGVFVLYHHLSLFTQITYDEYANVGQKWYSTLIGWM